MRTRLFAIVAASLAAILVIAAGLYVYDDGRSDLISEGVTVGGVDVGGMRAADARAKLRRSVLEPLQQPIVVRHRDRRFTLTATRAGVGVDLDGSVDAAVAASRDGNLVTRSVRGLTGKRLDERLDVRITYSKPAVDHLIRRVRAAVDRSPVDARVDLEHGSVDPRPARAGRALKVGPLKQSITTALVGPDAPRELAARTRVVQPKVRTDELADRYPVIIKIDRDAFTLTLFKRLERVKTYRIAVGQVGLETPAGLYHIQNKAINPAWHVPNSAWAGNLAGTVIPGDDPSNPIKARWMGIYDGAGIHGTDAVNSIGTAASHGCIRMKIPEVVELYDEVPVNAPVYIA